MRLAVRERDHVDLRLDVGPFQIAQRGDLNLVVEMADVADDRHVLHAPHVVEGDDILVAGGGDEDVGGRGDVFERLHLESRPSPPAARRSDRLRSP